MANSTPPAVAYDGYQYKPSFSPAENYILFQKGLSFENGVEFLTSSETDKAPILYLLSIPGLPIDIKEAKKQLAKCNSEILSHISKIINESSDLFEIFSNFYELYKAVGNLQENYRHGKDKYFGIVKILKSPVKAIKSQKLPVAVGNYRAEFRSEIPRNGQPVDYNKLGGNLKKQLSGLYMLRREYNMKLQKELKTMKQIFYKKKHIGTYCRYKGDIADLTEVAIALVKSGRIQNLNDEEISANQFYGYFCKSMGLEYTRLSNYLPTLHARHSQNKLFVNGLASVVKTFLENTKDHSNH